MMGVFLQMSNPTSDAVDLELACLRNVAYARIKQGAMEDAEIACFQVLKKQPTCVKALFRRGQARLALGRCNEAATDFREVTILEPNNAEASKMVRRAEQQQQQKEEEGKDSPPSKSEVVGDRSRRSQGENKEAGYSEPNPRTSTPLLLPSTARTEAPEQQSMDCVDQGDTRARPPMASATGSGCGVPLAPEISGRSKPADFKLEIGEEGEDAFQNLAETSVVSSPAGVSSFMVPDWLSSEQRRREGQQQGEGNTTSTDNSHCRSDGLRGHDLAKTDASGGVQSAVSVSRLVSQLSASHTDAGKNKQSQRGATATAAAQAEWTRLQAEESIKVQESIRKWSSATEPSYTTASATNSVNGEASGKGRSSTHGRKKKGKKLPTSTRTTIADKEPRETIQASEWWASLEEEEKQVRKAFRAKLSIAESKATKKKTQKKKKDVSSRSRAGVPP